MARMDHVMQIGEPGKAPRIYLEDYAYTYLKRQVNPEKKKYYLYGEYEGKGERQRLYIYGITDSAKEQNTYFKDHHSIGILKIRGDERFLVNHKGQETPISGFYVFYSPNQAMQEYLVDTNTEKKEEDILKEKPVRKLQGKKIPIKEKIVLSVGKYRRPKREPNFGNLVFYGGCIIALLLLVTAVSGGNGFSKLSRFKQMVVQTMNSTEGTVETGQLIVEEKKIGKNTPQTLETASDMTVSQEPIPETAQEMLPVEEAVEMVTTEETDEMVVAQEYVQMTLEEKSEEETETAGTEDTSENQEPEVYIVQEGDTLAYICMMYYGDTAKMDVVCEYNNIVNEDHIAPGQKLYLPK